MFSDFSIDESPVFIMKADEKIKPGYFFILLCLPRLDQQKIAVKHHIDYALSA